MITSPRIAKVEWVDSNSVAGGSAWSNIKSTVEIGTDGLRELCISVGFIIHEDDVGIVIVPHLAKFPIDDDTQGSGDMAIPKVAIVSITYLS
jgi:hypothetical protein